MNRKQGTPRPRKGFTLAELLIVVAIIAVLVAIAIPIFTSQLEKSRESVDLSNVRAAYAEVMSAAITDDGTAQYGGAVIKQGDGTFQATVSPLKQQQDDWAVSEGGLEIGGVRSDDTAHWIGKPTAGGSCTVSYNPGNGEVTITWSGAGDSPAGDPDPSDPATTTPEQAAAANNAVINPMSDIINRLVQGAARNSTSVEVSVTDTGKTTISVKNSDLNEGQIENELKDAGILKDDGTVAFDSNDTRYPNGYRITVNHNSGNNPVKIEPL